jgi:adenylate cyclase
MTTQEVKRKLTAILSADVKGYSRLMGTDEEGTLHTLTAYREVMTTLIQQHRGRVVNAPGDALLAEFESVVDAVKSAIEIQQELAKRNADLPEDRQMEYRIGINLGDVMVDRESIYGDGVNIAARMESLAEAGGICISGTGFDQVKNKLSVGYQYLGKQTVKNIPDPIRAYKVLMGPEAVGKVIGEKEPKETRWGWKAIAVVVALALVAGGLIWNFYLRVTRIELASKEKMAFPLPDLPSIAVMPFVNMSDDPKQEFLSDGISESIITALSKVPRLFVISRQSTFFYKGKPVKVKQVAEELGVQYVMEGSVQRSTDRIRINAQLIDALTGRHIWAERYDGDLKDIFALQDGITMKILTAVRVQLTEGEVIRMYPKYFTGKQGFDCYLKVLETFKYLERGTIEDTNVARRLTEEYVAMCPENAVSYSILARLYHQDFSLGNTTSPRATLEKAIELAQKAVAMDDSLSAPHMLLSFFYPLIREYDKGIAEGERAVALDPGTSDTYSMYASALLFACRPEEAIPLFQKAIRLNPNAYPVTFSNLGHAFRMTGRFEEAVSAFRKALQRAPNHLIVHIGLAATYSLMDREKEARAEVEQILRINPRFSLAYYKMAAPYKDQSETDKMVNALRKAGLK